MNRILTSLLFVAICINCVMAQNGIKWTVEIKDDHTEHPYILATATLEEGYHLYAQNNPPGGGNPLVFKLYDLRGVETIGGFEADKSYITSFDDIFEVYEQYYTGTVSFTQKLRPKATNWSLTVVIRSQICNESGCISVNEEERLSGTTSPISASSTINTSGSMAIENARLKDELQEKDKLINSYHKKFISIASNFLYLPYEEYNINVLAIPAYETTKGTPLYNMYKIRLQMLQNYARDIDAIINFLQKYRGTMPKAGFLKNWANGAKKEFENYAVVKAYKEYGDDWEETYLGKYIVKIFKQLNNLNGDANSRIYNAFGTYIKDLNSLLHPDEVIEEDLISTPSTYPPVKPSPAHGHQSGGARGSLL